MCLAKRAIKWSQFTNNWLFEICSVRIFPKMTKNINWGNNSNVVSSWQGTYEYFVLQKRKSFLETRFLKSA